MVCIFKLWSCEHEEVIWYYINSINNDNDYNFYKNTVLRKRRYIIVKITIKYITLEYGVPDVRYNKAINTSHTDY